MRSIAIHSNKTIINGTLKNATVFISNGSITSVEEGLVKPTADIDLTDIHDKILMAGLIDPHVHINEPGRTDWEGFNSATKAAIAGGITTLVDMPLNSSPVTTSAAAFTQKILATERQLHTNCGFWGGLVPGNDNEIEKLIAAGVLGFKAFLTHSGIDEFPNVSEPDLRKAMPAIAWHNMPLLVHCELESAVLSGKSESDPQSYQAYLASRPREWEDNAIALMIGLCEEYNCRVHIVHLSSSNSIQQIQNAKEKGLPLTVETGQHYLYFNAEDIPDGKTVFKCAPPIREKQNNELLWEALESGIIDFVATDHSPAPPSMKELESGNFKKAWGGISSIQFALPALWTAASKRNAGPADVAKWLSEKPAILTGKSSRKGKIAVGFDADLVAWDPDASFTINTDMIQHKHKITPYLNEQLRGLVEQTWLGGVMVFDRGNFTQLNKGKIILR